MEQACSLEKRWWWFCRFSFNTSDLRIFCRKWLSRQHGHYDTLGFLMCHAFPALSWRWFPLLLVCGFFVKTSIFSKWNAHLIRLRSEYSDLASTEYSTSLPYDSPGLFLQYVLDLAICTGKCCPLNFGEIGCNGRASLDSFCWSLIWPFYLWRLSSGLHLLVKHLYLLLGSLLCLRLT